MDDLIDAGEIVADAAPADAARIDADMPGPDAAIVPDAALPPDAHVCPDEYVVNAATGHAYRAFRPRIEWTEAVEECQDEGPGIHLVTINNAAELAAIDALVTSSSPIWVGASDRALEGDFVLVTGQPATFLPWAVGEPNNFDNEDCVELIGNKLNDDDCAAAHSYICECE